MAIGLALVGAAVLSAWLTGRVRAYALAHDILDVPNRRSSHEVPTPRGGGLAVVLCWLLAITALRVRGMLEPGLFLALFGGGLVIAGVGWWDDHKGLKPGLRLLCHFGAAAWTLAWIGGFPTLDLGVRTFAPGIVGSVLACVGLVWLTNLYNFMDGIDGLAAGEAVTAGAAGGVVLWSMGAAGLAIASWSLAAAALGFLRWNRPPARIFMGDVGSGFLGFAFGAIALAGERAAGVPAALLLVPLGVFIADATFTLFRRLLRGERIYEAHRSHVYQRLVQQGWTHGRVTLAVTAVNVLLALAAWGTLRHPRFLPWTLLGAAVMVALSGWGALQCTLKELAGRAETGSGGRERT